MMIMMMLVLQDGDVIQYTINVRKIEEDTEDNNIITLVRKNQHIESFDDNFQHDG